MSINAMAKKVFRPRHDYIPGTQVFSAIDVDRIKDELNLGEKGRQDGAENVPPHDATSPSSTELEIRRRCDNWRGTTLEEARRALEIYSGRVKASSEGLEVAKLRTMAKRAGLALEQEATDEVALLIQPEREVKRKTEDFRRFKEDQGIERSPRPPLDLWKALTPVALVALLEIAANSYFFFEAGNDAGILGAALEAVLIPAINISICWLIVFWSVRQLWRREFLKKAIGLFGLAGFLGFATTFNLGVAHFRDALSSFDPDAAKAEALTTLLNGPFDLASMQSWVLFAIGFAVSVVTMVDALAFRDPIPSYSRYDAYRQEAQDEFNDKRAEAVEAIDEAFEAHTNELVATRQRIANAQSEAIEIQKRVEHLQSDLADYGNYLQATANELAAAYREQNVAVRTDPRPAHFDQPLWELEPMILVAPVRELEEDISQLRDVESGQDVLEKGLTELNGHLDAAYKRLNELSSFELDEADL
ncbi:hypothetical protein WNY37_05590 [Henriciella sp. AS95]|uniref:hypothetical protein n=1 Tax=Henriciella sp. AS95 TaxID=3135782 RepID=UPI0031705B98